MKIDLNAMEQSPLPSDLQERVEAGRGFLNVAAALAAQGTTKLSPAGQAAAQLVIGTLHQAAEGALLNEVRKPESAASKALGAANIAMKGVNAWFKGDATAAILSMNQFYEFARNNLQKIFPGLVEAWNPIQSALMNFRDRLIPSKGGKTLRLDTGALSEAVSTATRGPAIGR